MAELGELTFGVEIKQCKECEYRNHGLRDDLLVTAGARAAYMDTKGIINIPGGVDHEGNLALFISKTVDRYLILNDVNFDLFIEAELYSEYGVKSPGKLYEQYKLEWCKARGYKLEDMDEEVGINGECYACFDEWYHNEFAKDV